MKFLSIMAVIAVAMLTVATPASARNHHYKIHGTFSFTHHKHARSHAHTKNHVGDATSLVASICDNDGHCRQEYSAQPERSTQRSTRTHSDARQTRIDPDGNPTTKHRATASRGICPGCVVVSTAANIDITVHAAYAAKFQAFIADLVAQGHHPRFITCFAYGHVPGSNHGIGAACDIDQTGWGKTSAFMYHSDGIISQAGLFSGCAFSRQDCGHVEAIRGTHNHPPNLYASLAKYQATRDYQP